MRRPILFLLERALRLYYRHERFGEALPERGPTLLVANHPNGLVDPILVSSLTRRPVRLLGKAPLFRMPVIGWLVRRFQVLPVYRPQDGADTAQNEATFEAVFDALEAGGLVCLFPEGTSHSEPELRTLKTGAARMALGAEARQGFGLGLQVVPVGLVYRAKRRFRSPVGTCVGRPIELADLAGEWQADGPAAVRALTERIAAGLERVMLTLDRWEDLPLIELAAELSRPAGVPHLTHLHGFAAAVHAARAREPEAVEALTARVVALRRRLDCLGLGPENLHAAYSARGVLRFVLRNLGALALLPPGLVGALAWAPPYLLTPVVPRRWRASRDVHATVQILTGLVLFPLWWCALWLGAWALWGGGTALAVALGLPPAGLAALALKDWRRERADDVRAFLVLGRRQRLRELLVRERDALAQEIEALRARLAARPAS